MKLQQQQLFSKAEHKNLRFGDVAQKLNIKVDRNTTTLDRYVAGEHIQTENLRLRGWGLIGDDYLGPAFHMMFKSGQILYVSRNPHLKKVAVPQFEGICANTTFVIEPKGNDLLPELLPFIMHSSAFTEHLIRESKGSTNPYVNWKDLAKYEFQVFATNEDQQRVARLILAAEDALLKSERLIDEAIRFKTAMTDRLLSKGMHHKAFKNTELGVLPQTWRYLELAKVCNKIQDGTHFSPKVQYNEPGAAKYLYITSKNIKEEGLDLSEITYLDQATHTEIYRRCNPERGDILLIKDGVKTGTATINSLEEEFSLLSSVALLKPRREELDSVYLKSYLNSPLGLSMTIDEKTGTQIKRITLENIRNLKIPLPPLAEQQQISAVLSRMERVINAGRNSVKEMKAMKFRLIDHFFSDGVIS